MPMEINKTIMRVNKLLGESRKTCTGPVTKMTNAFIELAISSSEYPQSSALFLG